MNSFRTKFWPATWTRIRYFCCLTSAHKSAAAAGPHTWRNIVSLTTKQTMIHKIINWKYISLDT